MTEFNFQPVKTKILTMFFAGNKITFDPIAGTLYVEVNENAVAKTKEPVANILVDYDRNGRVVGVQMLSPGHLKIEQKTLLRKMGTRHKIPALKDLQLGRIPAIIGAAA